MPLGTSAVAGLLAVATVLTILETQSTFLALYDLLFYVELPAYKSLYYPF